MENNRQITLSVGNSRKSMDWRPLTLWLSELQDKLRVPARSTETFKQYMDMPKGKQDELKDVGGFLAGGLSGPRRKAGAVIFRDLITLDLDNIPPGGTEDIHRRLNGLGVQYGLYSTRKHSSAAPRLRVLLPSDRPMTPDECEFITRYVADIIGMDFADPTTFEVTRFMYWPSVCADGEYVFDWQDKRFISVDGVLALFPDWRDVTTWPRAAGEMAHAKLAARQTDPLTKGGVVGVFCRAYDVLQAMEAFLPGIYEAVDTMPGRYTYLGGSTTGGAVVYDNDKFLYSHHATDPCQGSLVNAFDLVRRHKFGNLDDAAKEGTPGGRMPSYMAMCEFALADAKVSRLMAREDFADVASPATSAASGGDENLEWTAALDKDYNGAYKKTLKNVTLIIDNHPDLKGRIKKNIFTQRLHTSGKLPWDLKKETPVWEDADLTALRMFLEKWIKPTKADVKDAVELAASHNAYHPIREYLLSLKWDGIPRLNTLYMDYLGAKDDVYTGMVACKSLTACVKRVMYPGCKMDYMTVFIGPQGFKKSMLLETLGDEWFSASLNTFHGKEAMEAVRGQWIIEIPELNAFYRSEINAIKAFITRRSDEFRDAYGLYSKNNPRQCVFFGTTNDPECLRDTTGGRRFWPIEIDKQPRIKDVAVDLPKERDQIWAEAVVYWRLGEPLYLPPDVEKTAAEIQEQHREAHPLEDSILDFLAKDVPEDWLNWDVSERMSYWNGKVTGDVRTVPRDRVCIIEIWTEVLKPLGYTKLDSNDKRVITSVLHRHTMWDKHGIMRFGKAYGRQRGYLRNLKC